MQAKEATYHFGRQLEFRAEFHLPCAMQVYVDITMRAAKAGEERMQIPVSTSLVSHRIEHRGCPCPQSSCLEQVCLIKSVRHGANAHQHVLLVFSASYVSLHQTGDVVLASISDMDIMVRIHLQALIRWQPSLEFAPRLRRMRQRLPSSTPENPCESPALPEPSAD